jgi:HEAT repeats/PBS lyase HEAT-like repeat
MRNTTSMSTASLTVAASLLAATTVGVAIAAQQPRISNGQITARQAGSQFAQSIRTLVAAQNDAAWIGYAVPVVDSDRIMCCFDGGTTFIDGTVSMTSRQPNACRLEPWADGTSMARRPPVSSSAGVVTLDRSDRMIILIRAVMREVDRVRVFSEDCQLDAGGRPVIWLEDVRPADSIALLESLAGSVEGRRGVTDGSITAIALHADAAADSALERLVATAQPDAVRKKVTFWLGNARGARGLATLTRVLKEDPSVEVQKGAVFGISQSRERNAFDTLAATVKSHDSAKIRSEAVFWIAQQGDGRAPSVIHEALEKDPSPDVRKKAVFALSQLKDNAGVESLIKVARGSSDPAMRGEAVFWLGQKAGQKAAAEITERIAQDPNTEVQKKALHALSQFPRGEGVPHLIQVARTNQNPAVRKQAMFWLGQSRDQRAIDFFAEILKK